MQMAMTRWKPSQLHYSSSSQTGKVKLTTHRWCKATHTAPAAGWPMSYRHSLDCSIPPVSQIYTFLIFWFAGMYLYFLKSTFIALNSSNLFLRNVDGVTVSNSSNVVESMDVWLKKYVAFIHKVWVWILLISWEEVSVTLCSGTQVNRRGKFWSKW